MEKVKREKEEQSALKDQEKNSKKDPKTTLRRLVKKKSKPAEESLENPEGENFSEKPKSRWKLKILIIAVLCLVASMLIGNKNFSSCGFWAAYENNFNKIVFGDSKFCYRRLDPTTIVEKLKERVIGQDDAVGLISASLDLANREKVIQIAFIGKTGVGKTLTANILMSNFKWQQNVISLIYDINFQANLNEQEAYEADIAVVSSRLSDCGFNLVVIDDIKPTLNSMKRINELETRLHRMAKQNLYKIVFVVIFSGALDEAAHDQIRDFVHVDFNPFTKEMFQKCIEIHERFHNIKLEPKDIEELYFINYTISGCKTLAKKLNLISNKT